MVGSRGRGGGAGHLPQPALFEVAHHVAARRALDLAVHVVPRFPRPVRLITRQAWVVPVPPEEAAAATEQPVLRRVVPPCTHAASAELSCLQLPANPPATQVIQKAIPAKDRAVLRRPR